MPPTTLASSSDAGLQSALRRTRRFSRFTLATRWLRRTTFLVHRWLGIALAMLMTLWAASGVVMMYVSYPETSSLERVAGLEPLDLTACCDTAALPAGPVERATFEMLAGKPVLRWSGAEGPALVNLVDQRPATLGEAEAGMIASTYMRQAFGTGRVPRIEPVEVDQWTLQQRGYAPLYKATFSDESGTVLYVSGRTGEVVQDTHRTERFWNWLGAVPHWLYFTALRQDGQLWSQVVIYASLLGTFLTMTGIYVGLRMYGRGKRKSPFRGVALWHHWTGLIFGLATLTWVFSGLASMQPWGWLASKGPSEELAALAGREIEGADVAVLVQALQASRQPGVVSAELAIQGGERYAILVRGDGSRVRTALPDLKASPPSPADLSDLARTAKPGVAIATQAAITQGDAYHYGHHNTPAILPAWRVIYADAAATRIYFDPRTAELIGYADPGARQFRWWHLALHRLDFGGLNARPLWDFIMVPLILGISLLCGLGVWMGVRRLSWRWPINKSSRRLKEQATPASAWSS